MDEVESQLRSDVAAEHQLVARTVAEFDERLLTLRGWALAVTLSWMAAAIQLSRPALFGVAVGSALVCWLLAARCKRRQLRWYPRLRELEVVAAELHRLDDERPVAPGLADPWRRSGEGAWPPKPYTPAELRHLLRRAPLHSQVMLPHLLGIAATTGLYLGSGLLS